MRYLLAYGLCMAATLLAIHAEARWIGAHLDDAGRCAGVLVLAVLE